MEYTEQDSINIALAFGEEGDVWNNIKVDQIKVRLKEHYRLSSDEQCCYCKKDFGDEFNMVIDIEHILPKSRFPDYMFDVFNLNIACKRCNMRIKKDKIDFIVNMDEIVAQRLERSQYKFIHPNFDNYFNHLEVIQILRNNKKFIKYLVVDNSQKGKYTYKYFQLDRREIDTINEAQGVTIKESEVAELPEEITINLKELLKDI